MPSNGKRHEENGMHDTELIKHTQTMNTIVIKLMNLFGYEFIEEDLLGRLLFYEPDWEETVQLWKKETADETMKATAELIKTRLIDRAKSLGRYEVQSEIKKALGL